MKTLVLDLELNLHGISDHADFREALRDLVAMHRIDGSSETLSIDEWNFVRVADDVAHDVLEWHSLGAPPHLNPLMHEEAWRTHKKTAS